MHLRKLFLFFMLALLMLLWGRDVTSLPHVVYLLICTKLSVDIVTVGIACVDSIYAAYPVPRVESSRERFSIKNRGVNIARRRGRRPEPDVRLCNNIVMRAAHYTEQIRTNVACQSGICILNFVPVPILSYDMDVRSLCERTKVGTVFRI